MLSANPLKPELYATVNTDPFSINKLIPEKENHIQ